MAQDLHISSAKRFPRAGTVLAVFWLASVAAGFCLLLDYAATAGSAGRPRDDWPAGSTLTRDRGLPTLLLFLHPQCPCSSASVEEFSRILASCRGGADAHVIFVRPEGLDPDLVRGSLWDMVSRSAHVRITIDDGGQEARRLGVETSGTALLYDLDGRLRFRGGITPSRGHQGDNRGRSVLTALILGREAGPAGTPVFGCPIFATPPDPRSGAIGREG